MVTPQYIIISIMSLCALDVFMFVCVCNTTNKPHFILW